jgi:hypothetical protein
VPVAVEIVEATRVPPVQGDVERRPLPRREQVEDRDPGRAEQHPARLGAVLVVEPAQGDVRQTAAGQPAPHRLLDGRVRSARANGPGVDPRHLDRMGGAGSLLGAAAEVVLLHPALDEPGPVPPVEAHPAPGHLPTVQRGATVLGEAQRGAVLTQHQLVHGEAEARELAVLLAGGGDVLGVPPADLVLAHPQHVVVDHDFGADAEVVRGGVRERVPPQHRGQGVQPVVGQLHRTWRLSSVMGTTRA